MSSQRTCAGRKKRTYKSADVTQQIDEISQTAVEKTTPTRKLDFGQGGQGITSNPLTLSRAWEKDINTFLSNQRHALYTHDPLWELQLDENEKSTSEKERLSFMQQTPLSTDLVATDSFPDAPQQRVDLDRDLEETENEEEKEHQLIVHGETVYCGGGQFKPRGSGQPSPVVERNFSTPRLIETPDDCAFKVPPTSKGTKEVASRLLIHDFSPSDDANLTPSRFWRQQNQPKETILVNTLEGNALLDANDDSYIRTFSFPLGLRRKSCALSTVDDEQRYVIGEAEREKEIFAIPPLISIKRSSGEEEDAPLFKQSTFAPPGSFLSDTCTSERTKRPHYSVGMHVEGKWGRQWFGAVVTEEERNGDVQVRWDADGSFLHLKVTEVRLRKRRITADETNREKGLAGHSVMTATQLVEIMENETLQQPTLGTEAKGLNDMGNSRWLSSTSLSLFLTQTTLKSFGTSFSVLNTLVEYGVLVVESLSQLGTLNDETISIWRRQRHHGYREEPNEKYQNEMLFFVVTDEDAERDDGIVIAAAHAMGVSAVSVEWLKNLETCALGEHLRICVPKSQYLIGQGSDTNVRGRMLPRHKRFLSEKRIFMTVDDADILLLISLCGGIVTRKLCVGGGLSSDYMYIAPGKCVQVAPDVTSVALMERSWLIHRIHEFFYLLQSPRQTHDNDNGDDDSNNCSKKIQPLQTRGSGTKRSRQDEEFIENERDDVMAKNKVSESPQLRVDRDASRMSTPAANTLEVLEGEDYYFRLSNMNNSSSRDKRKNRSNANEAPIVALGRVVRLEGNDTAVAMRRYEVKYTVMQQNPRTGNIDIHTTLYLGSRITTVSIKDLIFDIPVYVVDASQMQHVYRLESPPRDTVSTSGAVVLAETEKGEEKERFQFHLPMNESETLLPDSIDPILMSTPHPIENSIHNFTPQQETLLNETLINGRRVRPGVDVRFYDHLSTANTAGSNGVQQSVGRVQMIQRAAKGVVLVVHKEEANSVFGGSKMVVITPDMVTDIV